MAGDQAKAACGNVQLCVLLEAGIKGSAHSIVRCLGERDGMDQEYMEGFLGGGEADGGDNGRAEDDKDKDREADAETVGWAYGTYLGGGMYKEEVEGLKSEGKRLALLEL